MRQNARQHCHWLVAVGNDNECYHCGHVHKAFSGGVVDPESCDIQPFGAGRVLHYHARGAQGDGAGMTPAAIAKIMARLDRSRVGEAGFVSQSGTPVAALASLKTLEILRRDGTCQRLRSIGETLIQASIDSLPAPASGQAIAPDPL